MLQNHFGDGMGFSHSIYSRKSCICFPADRYDLQKMTDRIQSTDAKKQCGTLLRISLMEYDFSLEDRLWNAINFKHSWAAIDIQKTAMDFLKALVNVNADQVYSDRKLHQRHPTSVHD